MPRVEAGQVTMVDRSTDRGILVLDSGQQLGFELDWEIPLEVGWRVLVTFGSKEQVVRIGLDLSAIGMTELDASKLANVGARFDALTAAGPLTDEQRKLFGAVIESHRASMGKDARKLRDRIERAMVGDTLPLASGDPWADTARADLATIAHRDAWITLLALTGDSSKPTKKWSSAAGKCVALIGVPTFIATIQRWFALVAPRKVVRDETNWYAPAMADPNTDALKNLVWACGTLDPASHGHEIETLSVAVGDLAVRCFTKIRGVGALSMKAGNACIYILSQLPGLRAVSQLSRLGARLRYKQALALVDKAMQECARREGVTPIDLEELSLPSFGLDVSGRARVEIGDYIAELALDGDDVKLVFLDGDRPMKSVPAAVKTDHAEELKELKTSHKELQALAPTVRARLERWLVEERSWALADLRVRYLDHPLAARLARRVIFTTGTLDVMFVDGYPIDVTGKAATLDDAVELSLWHPLGRPERELRAWRELLAALGITQPFKQVDRETYAVTDADRETGTSSNRFAGRLVRQHQFAALCRERGWTYSLQGQFDNANTPTKRLPSYDLEVELGIDATDEFPTSDSFIYVQVRTRDVRFLRQRRPVPLASVPARCFSEIMRDVDLFVSVCG